MNLIDAIKSGLPLRRKGRTSWPRKTCHGEHSEYLLCDSTQGHWMSPQTVLEVCILDTEDVLVEDWEVQEPAVTITASQFWAAWGAAQNEALNYYRMLTSPPNAISCYEDGHTPVEELARNLGLVSK